MRLKTVVGKHGVTAALRDGAVVPDGIELDFEEVEPINRAFRRMVRGLEFDVCEMAITTYLCAREYGKPFTALPVFPVRGVHHGAIVALRGTTPRDLEGRRVGVNRGYTVTTGVWVRGVLAGEQGVDLDRVTWVCTDDEHVEEYVPPPNVVRAPPGSDLAALLLAGEHAAAIGVAVDHPDVVPLVPDADRAAAALRERDAVPINHLVVVRDELLDASPGLASSLFAAFDEARRLGGGAAYGVEPNRGVLEELIGHALAQRILREPPALHSLFAPVG